MTEKKTKKPLKLHAIQLLSVNIVELFIRVNESPDEPHEKIDLSFSLGYSHGPYDEENKTIQTSVRLKYGMDDEQKTPFSMRVELFGEFKIDESQFPKKYIDDWAKRNAPYILMPYLREQIYALTTRCGFQKLILPLFEVPTFKIEKPSVTESENKES